MAEHRVSPRVPRTADNWRAAGLAPPRERVGRRAPKDWPHRPEGRRFRRPGADAHVPRTVLRHPHRRHASGLRLAHVEADYFVPAGARRFVFI